MAASPVRCVRAVLHPGSEDWKGGGFVKAGAVSGFYGSPLGSRSAGVRSAFTNTPHRTGTPGHPDFARHSRPARRAPQARRAPTGGSAAGARTRAAPIRGGSKSRPKGGEDGSPNGARLADARLDAKHESPARSASAGTCPRLGGVPEKIGRRRPGRACQAAARADQAAGGTCSR